PGGGVAGREHRAAVLIGEDGGVEHPDLPGHADDLHLVHADQGPQHRQGGHILGDPQGQHGLAGHLAQGLAGDQGAGVGLPGDGLGDAHHEPAHDEGEVLLRAVPPDLLLDLREGDDVDQQPPGPGSQQPGQLQYLVLGLLGGVGRGDKVDHLQLHAPAGHHPGGHRGVDAAGEQAHRPAAHADGQAARAGNRGSMNVGVLLPDLHKYRQIGSVDIHRHMGEQLRQIAAHSLAQLDGVHGKHLVCPLALHLEALRNGKGVRQIGPGGLHNGVHCLFTGHGPGHGGNAEHLAAGVPGGLHIAVLSLGLHVDGALPEGALEAAAVFHPAADVGQQLVLKGLAILSLQDHLAQFQ
ncbi:Phosphate/phosphite/phosphonate ABC transporters, periplasmic binding protein, partial [Dysosmobacter welbionis]